MDGKKRSGARALLVSLTPDFYEQDGASRLLDQNLVLVRARTWLVRFVFAFRNAVLHACRSPIENNQRRFGHMTKCWALVNIYYALHTGLGMCDCWTSAKGHSARRAWE